MDRKNTRIFFLILLLIVGILCLLGNPMGFSLIGLDTSVLELLTMLSAIIALMNVSSRSSPLTTSYAVLLLAVAVPFAIGVQANGLVRALRDFSLLFYVSFVFVGHFYYTRKYIGPEMLILCICWVATAFSVLFLFDSYLYHSDFLLDYSLHFRVIVAFAYLNLLARLVGVPGCIRMNVGPAIFMLCVLSLYAVTLRTRAFLLMLLVGGIVMLVGYLLSFHRRAARRLFILGSAVLLFVVVPLALGWVEFGPLASSSVGRILSLSGADAVDVTAEYRFLAWTNALMGFASSPISGVGLGTYMYLDPWLNGHFAFYPSAMMHSHYVHVLYVGGIVYLAGYLYLFYSIFSCLGGEEGSARESHLYGQRLIMRGFFSGFLIYVAFGTAWFAVTDAIVFWFLIGYFCQAKIRVRNRWKNLVKPKTVDGS